MKLNISTGADTSRGIITTLYGVEGIGKTTFASHFPDPLFIDLERGTIRYENIKRVSPPPETWEDLNEVIDLIIKEKPCKTLVIDTLDRAEALEVTWLAKKSNVSSIEDIGGGYGKGYTMSAETMQGFLHKLDRVADAGIHVLLIAHSQKRDVTLPEEFGSFSRYELKLGKMTTSQTAPLVKEWTENLYFVNYRTDVSSDEKKMNKTTKKATGGTQRVMYTTHRATWDAKNRFGLPDQLDFGFSSVAHLYQTDQPAANPIPEQPEPVQPVVQTEPTSAKPDPITERFNNLPDCIPAPARQLMAQKGIDPLDLQAALFMNGNTPDMNFPVAQIPSAF